MPKQRKEIGTRARKQVCKAGGEQGGVPETYTDSPDVARSDALGFAETRQVSQPYGETPDRHRKTVEEPKKENQPTSRDLPKPRQVTIDTHDGRREDRGAPELEAGALAEDRQNPPQVQPKRGKRTSQKNGKENRSAARSEGDGQPGSTGP